MDKVKERLQKNEQVDAEAYRARITELRMKKKRQRRGRDGKPLDRDSGEEDQDGAAAGLRLAAESGSNSDQGESPR